MDKLEELKTAINENLIAEDSAVQQAKQAYIEAKKALLDKRLELSEEGFSDAEKLVLEVYEQAVKSAKLALDTARTAANATINAIQVLIDEMHKTITTFLQENKELLQELGVVVKEVEQAKDNAKKDFKSHFESKEEFGDFVGHEHCPWGDKKPQTPPHNHSHNTSSLTSSQA